MRWGFQWGKVGSGALMLLIGGGLTLLFLAGGRISIWGVILCLVGVCTIISGLVGEEGVW